MMRPAFITVLAPTASPQNSTAGQLLHDGSRGFLFGNHLDTHQESRLKKDGTLKGRFYIIFTREQDEATR